MKNRIVTIAGGSGMLGQVLKTRFSIEGWKVQILSTSTNDPENGIYAWSPSEQALSPQILRQTDLVINLAGAGIADKRWTKERKRALYNSRIFSTRRLAEAINSLNASDRPAFISASAIGYYPHKSKAVMTEHSPAGDGFVAELCRDWETEAQVAEISDLSILRIGIVLSKRGGFLGRLREFANLALLAPLGTGKEKISWVHEEDIAEICFQLATKQLPHTVYNAVSPAPAKNETLIRHLNTLLGRPNFLPPIPAFAIRLLYGQMGVETVLSDQNVIPEALLNQGYHFKYPTLEEALKSVI